MVPKYFYEVDSWQTALHTQVTEHFALSERAAAEWEAINARPARELSGLRELMARPSPFDE